MELLLALMFPFKVSDRLVPLPLLRICIPAAAFVAPMTKFLSEVSLAVPIQRSAAALVVAGWMPKVTVRLVPKELFAPALPSLVM